MRGGPDTFLISCGVGDECWVMITGAVVDVVIVTLACALVMGFCIHEFFVLHDGWLFSMKIPYDNYLVSRCRFMRL